MLGAGKFDRVIQCDEPIITQPDSGGEVVTFADEATFTARARIQPLTGREALQANQTLAGMDTRINIRWSPRNERINALWRLRYRDTIYNIAAPPVDIDMAHREIEILCKSGLNAG